MGYFDAQGWFKDIRVYKPASTRLVAPLIIKLPFGVVGFTDPKIGICIFILVKGGVCWSLMGLSTWATNKASILITTYNLNEDTCNLNYSVPLTLSSLCWRI